MTMAYKGIMGRDTGTSMPIGITRVGITRVGVTCFPVAAGCSAVGIGRPSACIGRVISGEIERVIMDTATARLMFSTFGSLSCLSQMSSRLRFKGEK